MATIRALGSVTKVRGALTFVQDIEAAALFYRDVMGLEGNPLQLYESAYIRPDADPEARAE